MAFMSLCWNECSFHSCLYISFQHLYACNHWVKTSFHLQRCKLRVTEEISYIMYTERFFVVSLKVEFITETSQLINRSQPAAGHLSG